MIITSMQLYHMQTDGIGKCNHMTGAYGTYNYAYMYMVAYMVAIICSAYQMNEVAYDTHHRYI